jgi:HrpA-like RNA helicase
MVLPTLLQKGKIVPPKGTSKSEKDRLANMIGIDYIMNFISDRLPITTGSQPKIRPKSIGDKVLVLRSDTGSGKSTVIPPYLYEKFQERTRKNISVTQPRILTAKSIAEGTPENYSFMKIDVNVGYSTKEMKRLPLQKGVIYMTIQTLLQQIKIMTDEEFMKKYSFILIDEVHDRGISVDVILFLLKKLLAVHFDNPECPFIILMSATFNPNIFLEYFDCPPSNFIQIEGATFPIEKHFAKFDVPDYLNYATNLAEELHIKNISEIDDNSDFRDILIFVSVGGKAKKILDKLHAFNANILSKPFTDVLRYLNDKKTNTKLGGQVNDDKQYYIAPIELTSTTFRYGGTEYQNLFSPIDSIMVPIYSTNDKGVIDTKSIKKWVKPTRRIIVATNIAETGVTIETLKYCIDTGFIFSVNFNPDFGTQMMLNKNITKGMAIQRRGRVGRKSPGIWYACYTEEAFESLQTDQFAEILTNDITNDLMGIIVKETESQLITKEQVSIEEYKKDKNFFITNYLSNSELYLLRHVNTLNFSTIDLFEMPAGESLIYSVEKLYGLGFIDSQYNPTILGLYSLQLGGIKIESLRMILAGYSHGANVLDLITIASFIEAKAFNVYSKKYKPFNPLKSKIDDKDYDFYYKVIIGDQFIEFLLNWELYSEFLNEMMDSIRKKSNKGQPYSFNINKLEKWCQDHLIEYSEMNNITKIRNDIIASFITVGLNPYYNGMDLESGTYNLLNIMRNDLEEGLSEIKKIKKCILDGYRFNLCVWDDTSKKYIIRHRNIPISIIRNNLLSRMGDDAQQRNANFVIVCEVSMRESQKNPGIYEFNASDPISIMDSLDIDLEFLNH